MKTFFTFLISLLIGLSLIFSSFFYAHKKHMQELVTPSAKHAAFDLTTPPKESITGNLLLFKNMKWQSRTATEPAELTQSVPIHQGETIQTDSNGSAKISFPQVGQMNVGANTNVSFVQTLPESFVVEQDSGVATYMKNGTTPLSVRSLSVLFHLNNGNVTVSVSDDQTTLSTTILKGSLVAAFNDANNVSNVLTANTGDTFTFDAGSKTGRVK